MSVDFHYLNFLISETLPFYRAPGKIFLCHNLRPVKTTIGTLIGFRLAFIQLNFTFLLFCSKFMFFYLKLKKSTQKLKLNIKVYKSKSFFSGNLWFIQWFMDARGVFVYLKALYQIMFFVSKKILIVRQKFCVNKLF